MSTSRDGAVAFAGRSFEYLWIPLSAALLVSLVAGWTDTPAALGVLGLATVSAVGLAHVNPLGA